MLTVTVTAVIGLDSHAGLEFKDGFEMVLNFKTLKHS